MVEPITTLDIYFDSDVDTIVNNFINDYNNIFIFSGTCKSILKQIIKNLQKTLNLQDPQLCIEDKKFFMKKDKYDMLKYGYIEKGYVLLRIHNFSNLKK